MHMKIILDIISDNILKQIKIKWVHLFCTIEKSNYIQLTKMLAKLYLRLLIQGVMLWKESSKWEGNQDNLGHVLSIYKLLICCHRDRGLALFMSTWHRLQITERREPQLQKHASIWSCVTTFLKLVIAW